MAQRNATKPKRDQATQREQRIGERGHVLPANIIVVTNTDDSGPGIQRVFAPAQKIALWVMEHTANGQQAEFFVVLTDQADLSEAVKS